MRGLAVTMFFIVAPRDRLEGVANDTLPPGFRFGSGLVAWCAMSGQELEPVSRFLLAHLSSEQWFAEIWDGLVCPEATFSAVYKDRPSWLDGRIDQGRLFLWQIGQSKTDKEVPNGQG